MRMKVDKKVDKLIEATALLLLQQHSTTITTIQVSRLAEVTQPLIHYYYKKCAMQQLCTDAIKWLEENDTEGYERVFLRESLCVMSRVSDYIKEVKGD